MSAQTEYITKGSSQFTALVNLLQDNSGTNPGDPLTGITSTAAGLVCYYKSGATGALTSLSLATLASTSAFSLGGFAEISSANAPGMFRLDLSTTLFSSGDNMGQVLLSGYVNLAAHSVHVKFTDLDFYSSMQTELATYGPSTHTSTDISDLNPTNFSLTVISTNGVVDSDLSLINGSTTALDNFSNMYDGTGYVDDTAPASRAQVGGIGAASGGGFNFAISEDNTGGAIKSITFVGSQTLTYTATEAEDGTYHDITHATNAFDIVYGAAVGGGRTASFAHLAGYLDGANDTANIQAYDFIGADWETVFVLAGQGSSVNRSVDIPLLAKHTGTGADIGKVYVRFVATGQTSPVLHIDKLQIEAAAVAQSVGYANGRIYVDTVNGTAGTENYVNGTADNSVLTWADALTIAASLNIHDFHIINGSSITFTASTTNFSLFGNNWTLALGGQDITGAYISGASVSGIATATGDYELAEGNFNAVTLDNDAHIDGVGIAGTLTVGQAGTFTIHNCFSESATGVAIDFGALGATTINLFNFQGDIIPTNMAVGDLLHIVGGGTIVTATCTGGIIEHDGFFEYTDAGGNVTEQQSDIKVNTDTLVANGATSTLTSTDVNDQVKDVIFTDTITLIGQAAPSNTPTIAEALGWLFKKNRNLMNNDGSTTQLMADDGTTVDQKQTTSVSSGVVTKAEWITGP